MLYSQIYLPYNLGENAWFMLPRIPVSAFRPYSQIDLTKRVTVISTDRTVLTNVMAA